jgi:hypothetical protein
MTFRLAPHTLRPGVEIVEIWEDGEFIAQLVPSADVHGELRLISKHHLLIETVDPRPGSPGVLQVRIVVA